jgi:hypothetical protein
VEFANIRLCRYWTSISLLVLTLRHDYEVHPEKDYFSGIFKQSLSYPKEKCEFT